MLHINGEIGGGIGMFGRVPDPQPFTFLGATPVNCPSTTSALVQKERARLAELLGFHFGRIDGREEFDVVVSSDLKNGSGIDEGRGLIVWSSSLFETLNGILGNITGRGNDAVPPLPMLRMNGSQKSAFGPIIGLVGRAPDVKDQLATLRAESDAFLTLVQKCEADRAAVPAPRHGLSTGAKVAIGVGVVVLAGGVALALRPRASFSGARRRGRKAA